MMGSFLDVPVVMPAEAWEFGLICAIDLHFTVRLEDTIAIATRPIAAKIFDDDFLSIFL